MKVCTKCLINPPLSYHQYCYSCLRVARGQPEKPKFTRDVNNKTLCSKCKIRPRLSYQNYCRECKNETTAKWQRINRPWSSLSAEEKHKAVIRRFVKWKVDSGKLKRLPCEVCGKPKSESDHYLGYSREHALHVKWLCSRHHHEAEKSRLTQNIS